MPKYEPKPATVEAEGKPKFDLGKFLDETVRMSDHATRDLHFVTMNKAASPKRLNEIIDAYQHVINRITYARDDLIERVRQVKETGQ